jgi:NADH:ubiquinone oxidoreductase subunit 5 (subunit L)/multisubunit Na+/H+ antiporter MnhA subunit
MLLTIIFVPLISAFISGFFGHKIGTQGAMRVTTLLMGYNLSIILYLVYNVILNETNYSILLGN